MNRQRLGLWGTFAFATLAVIGMLVQVYLIGGYIFGGGNDWLDAHKNLGKVVHLFYVLTFVAALVGAWPDWRRTGWPFALAAVGTVQAFLAGRGHIDGSNAALHAFHAALVPIVFVIAFMIAWRTWKMLQGSSATSETATT